MSAEGKKSKRKWKRKVQGSVKKPLSAYMEFCKDLRPIVLATDGNLSLPEIGKELGRRWRELDVESKKRYLEIASENKAKFIEDQRLHSESNSLSESSSVPAISVQSSGDIGSNRRESEEREEGIKMENLGFAKQGKYPLLMEHELK